MAAINRVMQSINRAIQPKYQNIQICNKSVKIMYTNTNVNIAGKESSGEVPGNGLVGVRPGKVPGSQKKGSRREEHPNKKCSNYIIR